VLERLKTEIADELARLRGDVELDERVARAMTELDRNLDPLIRQVGEQARGALAALEARDAAPSPFIRKPESSALLGAG